MSSVTDDDTDHWLDLDTNYSVPSQTLEEILAEGDDLIDDDFLLPDEDDSFGLNKHGPIYPVTYTLDTPLILTKEDAISHQLNMVRDNPNGGRPTVIAMCEQYVAIGTMKGMAIVFDKNDGRLIRFMSNNQNAPVSAMGFSADGSKLGVGYSNGALIIFRTSNGKMKLFNESVVQPDHGIIQVEYLNRYSMLVIDNGGSVFEIREGRKGPPRCIFTGCKGEAVQLRVLPQEGLLLLTTLKQILIFNQRTGRILSQLRLPNNPQCPPLLDFNIQTQLVSQKTYIHDVRLATARGNEIRIYTMNSEGRTITFPLSKVIKLDSHLVICNLFWMENDRIAVSNSNETMYLVDVHNGNVLVTIGLERVKLVYNLAEFKGLYTGGNVSEAFQFLAPNVCYQSAKRFNKDVYFLGTNGLFRCNLMTEKQQLNHFLSRSDVVSAILYAMDISKKLCNAKVLNLNVFQFMEDRIPDLLLRLLDMAMDGLESGRVSELVEHYKKHLGVLIRVCVEKRYFDLLYDTIYPRIEKDGMAKAIFLEILEEFAVEGRLEYPPPSLVHDLLSYLANEGQFSVFENAVSHIPVECLDLHQVITTCRANKLFDGIIYVMNNALVDYIGPLEEMCCNLSEFVPKTVFSDFEIAQGNKLFLYLSACLAGRSYPVGDLIPERAEVVSLEVYKFMIAISYPKVSQLTKVERYPILNLLLSFDAHQFLNVISTCADAPIFSDSDGRLKRLVDILAGITEENPEYLFLLLPFLTHLLETNAVGQDPHTYEKLILRVIERLNLMERPASYVQQQVVDLMMVSGQIPEDNILVKAKEKPLISICAYIYIKRKEYVNLLLVCLDDKYYPEGTFEIINNLLDGVENEDRTVLREFVVSSLNRLNSIDSWKTAKLFLENFPEFMMFSQKLPLDFLSNCFKLRRDYGFKSISEEDEVDESLFRSLFKGIIDDRTSSNVSSEVLDQELSDLLRYWLPLGSRDDVCLNMATSNGLTDSMVILLVARGHFERAFNALFEKLQQSSICNSLFTKRMEMIMGICSQSMDLAKAKSWWIKLFNFVLSVNNGSESLDEYLTELLTLIVETCGDQAVQVVDSLFSHPQFSSASVSGFQGLITKILFSCQIDRQILVQTRKCIEYETVDLLTELTSASRKLHGVINSDMCVCCNGDIIQSFIIFECGHLAHLECVDAYKRRCPCTQTRSKFIRPIERNFARCLQDSMGPAMFSQENLELRSRPEPMDPF
ncbi:unnamed protein product [Bursaphelenchus xylophilus]|uniref:(pine wood nematode) hypothetical protein n=1 Tax=Bursaphelenchus xylophilus TaxID=6326 RepID=A0A1I7S3E9_BURXY|nr:unnamed protein product [Bursaphelenchus xylophilus]CAG9116261.1 unnamed protein product [Bursaphelenchus xylophilus]